LLLLSGLTIVLAGCGTLSDTIQQRIVIAEQCRQVLDGTYRSQWEIPDKLLARRLGSINSCSPLGSSFDKTDSEFVALCAFDEIDRTHRLCKPEEGRSQVSDARWKLKWALDNLRKSVSEADTLIWDAVDHCKRMRKTAHCIVAEEQLPVRLTAFRDHILEDLAAVRKQLTELRLAIGAIAPSVSQAAIHDIAAWEANFKAQLAKFEQAAAGDVQVLVKDSVRNHALRYSARRSLDLLHKALRPIDGALNRADDKAYGAISAGNFFFGNSIQTAVSESFSAMKESYRTRLGNKECLIVDFLVEMGRAACEDIEKKTEFSMLTELVDTMFISNINGAIKKSPRPSTDMPKSDDKVADSSGAAPTDKNPVALDALIGASSPPTNADAMDEDVNTSPPTTANTIPADIYMVHEWAARQLLLKRLIQERNKAVGGSMNGEMFVAEAVDEAAVERLAESAAAEVIDDALRASPTPGVIAAASTPQSSISLSAAMQSVVQVSAVLAPTIFVSSVNNVSPSFAPVINVSERKPRREINLCSEANLPESAACAVDGKSFVIVLHEYYQTGECESEPIHNLVAAVASRIQRFAVTNGLQFDARVDGYASKRPIKGTKCRNVGGRSKEKYTSGGLECRYRNFLRETIGIRGCYPGSREWREGNILLSARRATRVAQLLEQNGGGAIVVQDVIANGSESANAVPGNNDLQSDRAAIIRLRAVGSR
jgi:hypothetical protein